MTLAGFITRDAKLPITMLCIRVMHQSSCAPRMPPTSWPRAQPPAKTAISRLATKSLKPSSCSQSVKNTIAFQGIEPTIPYASPGRCPSASAIRSLLASSE